MSEYYDDEHDFEPIEGYCMRCRESIEMEEAVPVWTRKGQPATRGVCPICGGTVFRMGKTDLHRESERPEAVIIGDEGDKRTRAKLSRDTVYVNFASSDEDFAQQIADDLEKSGLAVWLHDGAGDDVAWSSGVHPALKECSRMVLVLSADTSGDGQVVQGWQVFRQMRKPIVIAQVTPADLPDDIRRSPRYDLTQDYKRNFRQMLGALSQ